MSLCRTAPTSCAAGDSLSRYWQISVLFGIETLKPRSFKAKLRGFNVSMPNKTEICQYLDKLSPAAQLVGAVNTVVIKAAQLQSPEALDNVFQLLITDFKSQVDVVQPEILTY
jgi:hypothetical protein